MRERERAHSLAAITSAIAAVLSVAGCADILPGGGGDEPGRASDGGAAGSDGGAGEADIPRCVEKSGTRLKTVVLDHGVDDADLVGFIDTEQGDSRCRFRIASDGVLRCLPDISSGAVFTGAIRVWTDAGCSNAIGEVSYEGTPASFVVFDFPSWGPCPDVSAGTRYHLVGSRLPYDGTQTVYERDPDGACVARTAYFNRSYYTLGAEMPPSTFVGTEERYSDGRVAVRSADGEDGSRYCDHTTLRDSERDEACTIGLAEDGTQRCLPYATFHGTLYTDSTCSTGTSASAQSTECSDRNPLYTLGPSAGCGQGRPYHQRGALARGSFYYMAGTCTPLDASYDVFQVGDHVLPSEFAALADEQVQLGRRLRRVDLVGGGARIHRDLWYDPYLENTCWFRRNEDGVWRCVPVSRPGVPIAGRAAIRNGFSDAACTAAVQAVAEDCSGVSPRYVVDTGDDSRVYPVEAKLVQLYQSAGTCMPVNGTWYKVGAAIPTGDLASAVESTR